MRAAYCGIAAEISLTKASAINSRRDT